MCYRPKCGASASGSPLRTLSWRWAQTALGRMNGGQAVGRISPSPSECSSAGHLTCAFWGSRVSWHSGGEGGRSGDATRCRLNVPPPDPHVAAWSLNDEIRRWAFGEWSGRERGAQVSLQKTPRELPCSFCPVGTGEEKGTSVNQEAGSPDTESASGTVRNTFLWSQNTTSLWYSAIAARRDWHPRVGHFAANQREGPQLSLFVLNESISNFNFASSNTQEFFN